MNDKITKKKNNVQYLTLFYHAFTECENYCSENTSAPLDNTVQLGEIYLEKNKVFVNTPNLVENDIYTIQKNPHRNSAPTPILLFDAQQGILIPDFFFLADILTNQISNVSDC